eukprot:1152351-Pelagomonas_calceolata.AAC.6
MQKHQHPESLSQVACHEGMNTWTLRAAVRPCHVDGEAPQHLRNLRMPGTRCCVWQHIPCQSLWGMEFPVFNPPAM